jgi:ubiquinone/menaquinone biosynthesis C-methylase UbiE
MSVPTMPPEFADHYRHGVEQPRLLRDVGQLELTRTQELLERFLPPPPSVILDVGGGPGVYSFWLARKGYTVHLVDVLPLHIAQAKETAQKQSAHPASMSVGDARQLAFEDASADAVLLMGPLYHLTERADRFAAWKEAGRVLKPGGVVCAAAVSRYASTFDGLRLWLMDDPVFVGIWERDVRDGQHRNPTGDPKYFTTTFFHEPGELTAELTEAGFRHEGTFGVEGPGWLLPNFAADWQQPQRRELILRVARALEQAPSVMGVNAHLLAVGRKR